MNANTISTFDSDCIRKKSNWSKSNPDFKLDSKSFDSRTLFEKYQVPFTQITYIVAKNTKIRQRRHEERMDTITNILYFAM